MRIEELSRVLNIHRTYFDWSRYNNLPGTNTTKRIAALTQKTAENSPEGKFLTKDSIPSGSSVGSQSHSSISRELF